MRLRPTAVTHRRFASIYLIKDVILPGVVGYSIPPKQPSPGRFNRGYSLVSGYTMACYTGSARVSAVINAIPNDSDIEASLKILHWK